MPFEFPTAAEQSVEKKNTSKQTQKSKEAIGPKSEKTQEESKHSIQTHS